MGNTLGGAHAGRRPKLRNYAKQSAAMQPIYDGVLRPGRVAIQKKAVIGGTASRVIEGQKRNAAGIANSGGTPAGCPCALQAPRGPSARGRRGHGVKAALQHDSDGHFAANLSRNVCLVRSRAFGFTVRITGPPSSAISAQRVNASLVSQQPLQVRPTTNASATRLESHRLAFAFASPEW